jgi:hypothetical protein
VCSSLSTAGTHCLAPQLSVSDHREDVYVGLRRACFQVAVLLRSSRSDGLHGIQVVVHMQLRRGDGVIGSNPALEQGWPDLHGSRSMNKVI